MQKRERDKWEMKPVKTHQGNARRWTSKAKSERAENMNYVLAMIFNQRLYFQQSLSWKEAKGIDLKGTSKQQMYIENLVKFKVKGRRGENMAAASEISMVLAAYTHYNRGAKHLACRATWSTLLCSPKVQKFGWGGRGKQQQLTPPALSPTNFQAP